MCKGKKRFGLANLAPSCLQLVATLCQMEAGSVLPEAGACPIPWLNVLGAREGRDRAANTSSI